MTGTTRLASGTAATPWPCWPGSAAVRTPGQAARNTSPSPPPPPPAGRTCGTRRPPATCRQALSDPHGRYGLAWQIDLKAGWSYGIAPGATTTTGTYQIRGGDLAQSGHMPTWLAREVSQVASRSFS